MEYIFDFNQAKMSKIEGVQVYNDGDIEKTRILKVDMTDLVILHYILEVFCSQTMRHLTEDGVEYVWINRSKLLEDLPILDIKANRLSHIFEKLETLNLIKRKQVANTKQRGSMTYFTITDLLISCLNDTCDLYFSLSVVKNNNSNTCNINNINIINYNNKDMLELSKITTGSNSKENLFVQCTNDISEYTSNEALVNVLTEYLNMRIKRKDRPFSRQIWRSLLFKTLSNLSNSDDVKVKIVNQSITKNWASFFEFKSYGNSNGVSGRYMYGSNTNVFCETDATATNKKMTKEERERLFNDGQKF